MERNRYLILTWNLLPNLLDQASSLVDQALRALQLWGLQPLEVELDLPTSVWLYC